MAVLKVLAVAASLNPDSVTKTVIDNLAERLRAAGSSVDLPDFHTSPLFRGTNGQIAAHFDVSYWHIN